MGGAVSSVMRALTEPIGELLGVPKPQTAGQEAQLALQKMKIDQQEAATKAKESALAQESQRRILARRGGGQRMLLSQERTDSELGVQSKLGG